MSSLVRSLGYEACLFASAEAFLASPHLDDTSCLIADIQMPGMNGLDLQSELHARQLSKRGGELFCEDRGTRVGIGGTAVTYVEGTLQLPDR